MTTIPLSTVVSYLTRKGVDLACLEGAPLVLPVGAYVGRLRAYDGQDTHPETALYLGSDPVCPAAMGWATTVLGRSDDWIEDENGRVLLWHRGDRLWYHLWAWGNRSVPGPDITVIEGPTPPTPAARLRAVLEYEMGRDQ